MWVCIFVCRWGESVCVLDMTACTFSLRREVTYIYKKKRTGFISHMPPHLIKPWKLHRNCSKYPNSKFLLYIFNMYQHFQWKSAFWWDVMMWNRGAERERDRDRDWERKEVGVLYSFGKEGIFPTLNDLSRWAKIVLHMRKGRLKAFATTLETGWV